MSEPDDDECEVEIECPYCDGDGWQVIDVDGTGRELRAECPECGGTGWY